MMLPQNVMVYFAIDPVDMRKSFDGLMEVARNVLFREPKQGGLFVFLNRKTDQVRIVFVDRQGTCLFAKRLDGARFRPPIIKPNRTHWEANPEVLLRFLEEVEVLPGRRQTKGSRTSSAERAPLRLTAKRCSAV